MSDENKKEIAIEGLAAMLRKMYRSAPDDMKGIFIHLFGIKYHEQINDLGRGASAEINRRADLGVDLSVDLRIGVKLGSWVEIKEDFPAPESRASESRTDAEPRQRDKFTWYPGDVVINTLSNTVPRLPEEDMQNLLGKELYDRILAGFDGPAYDVTGEQVTPASLYELYGGTAFNKFMDGRG